MLEEHIPMPLSYKLDREETPVLFIYLLLWAGSWCACNRHAPHNDIPLCFYLSLDVFFFKVNERKMPFYKDACYQRNRYLSSLSN